jgi:hypothetical protein
LSIAGSPITTSGTLAITLSGTALPVANGGTGLTTLTSGDIPFGNGTSAFNSSANLTFVTSTLTVSTSSTSVGAKTSYTNTASTHEFGILPTGYGGYGVLTAGAAYIYGGNNQPIQLAVDNSYIAFGTGTGATERMRLLSGGTLVVGNTVSVQGSIIEATSSSASVPAMLARVNANSDESQWAFQTQKKTSTNTTAQIFVRFLINDGATPSGYITANGANAATFTSSSDARLKENIVDLPSQLANILALQPVEFDYIDGSGSQIGFIAQQMQTVYPDSVSEGPDGMLRIGGWSKTEARLVKAIQEQQAIIEQLKAKVGL